MIEEMGKDELYFNRALKDPSEWDKYFKAYMPRMHRVAYSIVRNREDAEDVVGESMDKIINKAHTYDHKGTPSTWVNSIVIRTALDKLKVIRRTKTRNVPLDTLIEDDNGSKLHSQFADLKSPDPFQNLVESQKREALINAIAGLGKIHQEAVLSHHLGGATYDEVARQLGISVGTVKTRVRQANAKLLNALDGKIEPE